MTALAKCLPLGGSAQLELGWGCCRCRTYNSEKRLTCRQCSHERCDDKAVEQRLETSNFGEVNLAPSPWSDQARNAAALAAWDLEGRGDGRPVPPSGSGCRVYGCFVPCAPDLHYCGAHGGMDATPAAGDGQR